MGESDLIRTACLSDIPHLLEIEKLSFLPCDRFNKRQFKYAIDKYSHTILLATSPAGIPMAYIYVIHSGRLTGRIYSLAVNPYARGKGIGRKLLKRGEKLFLTKGFSKLEVRVDNWWAIKFYIDNDYKYVKLRHNYYKDGMDAIVMKKDLRNAQR